MSDDGAEMKIREQASRWYIHRLTDYQHSRHDYRYDSPRHRRPPATTPRLMPRASLLMPHTAFSRETMIERLTWRSMPMR